MAGGVSSSIQDSRRRVSVRRRKRILLRNEAQLNCVSLRSRFDCGRAAKPVKGRDERPSGALDSPRRAVWENCCYFSLDSAGVVIDGMLPNLGYRIPRERL